MKKLLVISYWLLVSFISEGHPGIGIVKDSKGNIYYTDLAKSGKSLWMAIKLWWLAVYTHMNYT